MMFWLFAEKQPSKFIEFSTVLAHCGHREKLRNYGNLAGAMVPGDVFTHWETWPNHGARTLQPFSLRSKAVGSLCGGSSG